MLVFSMRDVKADYFMTPKFARTRFEIQRSLETAVNDPESDFGKYSADFQLYEIGSFDEMSGVLKGHPLPQLVCSAMELKRVGPMEVAK